MRVVVQIPCYNEEETLPQTLADIPRRIEGVDSVEILVVDDGSTDRTVEVARRLGVRHVVSHRRNRGLAAAFRSGLEHSLRLGADVIVNTDADNQYAGDDIPRLIAPILAGEADIVVGNRQTATIPHFSWTKKLLQRLGSSMIRRLSGVDVEDAVSGFRAMSRWAASRLSILSSFSYTIEMLIQAGNQSMSVVHVPIRVNPQLRESRLFRSIPQFLLHSAVTALRTYAMYRPLRVFWLLGGALCLIGGIPIARFLYLYLSGDGEGHIQSLILGGVALVLGFLTLLVGLLSDLIAFNRRLIEMVLMHERRRDVEIENPQPALKGPGGDEQPRRFA